MFLFLRKRINLQSYSFKKYWNKFLNKTKLISRIVLFGTRFLTTQTLCILTVVYYKTQHFDSKCRRLMRSNI